MSSADAEPDAEPTGADDRAAWLGLLGRVARPPLAALAEGRLRRDVDRGDPPLGGPSREPFMVLEALARTLGGISPWLAADAGGDAERALRDDLRGLAVRAIAVALDPDSPDAAAFDGRAGSQTAVDAAVLCYAFLRAPEVLWEPLAGGDKARFLDGLRATRAMVSPRNNHLLFAAMNETWLRLAGADDWDPVRVDYALLAHEARYAGDGLYLDGTEFHLDYYNSLVIVPWTLEICRAHAGYDWRWDRLGERVVVHLKRVSAILERLVAPDGSFPPVGRSLTYRCGVFTALALSALRHELPDGVSPGQARAALTAVIGRTLGAPGTFTEGGWLTPGLCGRQPALAEGYINVGSLYACSWAFGPLGLPPDDPFWAEPPRAWTQKRLWSGGEVPIDAFLKE